MLLQKEGVRKQHVLLKPPPAGKKKKGKKERKKTLKGGTETEKMHLICY